MRGFWFEKINRFMLEGILYYFKRRMSNAGGLIVRNTYFRQSPQQKFAAVASKTVT